MTAATALPIPRGLILWCWALAALLLGLVGIDRWRRAGGLVRRAFAVAALASAVWALAMAGIDGNDLVTRLAEGLRTLAWLGFMAVLARDAERRGADRPQRRGTAARAAPASRGGWLAIGAVYGVVALIVLAGMGLAVMAAILPMPGMGTSVLDGRLILRMMASVSALVLIHQLAVAASGGAPGGLRLVIAALAAIWASDLLFYLVAYALEGWPPVLVAARALTTLALAPVLAVAAHRDGDWTLRVSRAVAWQTLRAMGVFGYLAAMLLGTAAIERWGGSQVRLWQTAFVVGTGTAMLTLLANPWLRAWTRVKIAKHLFRHRYDYRAEWVRFTDTLGRAEGGSGGGAPLGRRIVQA